MTLPTGSSTGSHHTAGTATVFGATGQIGVRLVRLLAERGYRVCAVSRSATSRFGPAQPHLQPPGQQVIAVSADLIDREQAVRAAAGSELIFHLAGAPYRSWAAQLPAAMDGAIAAARESGARLVYLDNLYCYGAADGPLRPNSPIRPVGELGRIRAHVAARLDVARTGSVLVRVSDFYGSGPVRSTPGVLTVDRIRAGRTGRWPFALDQPHSLHYLPDVVRGLADLGTDPRAAGRVWHLPADEPPTGGGFVRAVARAFGRPERAALLSAGMLRIGGLVSADARDLASLAYQFSRPWVIDGSETTAAFGWRPTPQVDALATIAAR